MTRPYVCPVCEGRGAVPPGFYGTMTTAAGLAALGLCRSCGGSGVLWGAADPGDFPFWDFPF